MCGCSLTSPELVGGCKRKRQVDKAVETGLFGDVCKEGLAVTAVHGAPRTRTLTCSTCWGPLPRVVVRLVRQAPASEPSSSGY